MAFLVLTLANCKTTPSDAECVQNSECFSDEVCNNYYCVPVLPGTYVFTFDSATIDPADANGNEWDSVLGIISPPDPRIVVEVDGVVVFESSEIEDTLDPVWNESTPPIELYPDMLVSVYVYDVDSLSEEIIAGYEFEAPFCPSCLHEGVFNATATDTMIEFGFLIDSY
jgi:hypothetical protein